MLNDLGVFLNSRADHYYYGLLGYSDFFFGIWERSKYYNNKFNIADNRIRKPKPIGNTRQSRVVSDVIFQREMLFGNRNTIFHNFVEDKMARRLWVISFFKRSPIERCINTYWGLFSPDERQEFIEDYVPVIGNQGSPMTPPWTD